MSVTQSAREIHYWSRFARIATLLLAALLMVAATFFTASPAQAAVVTVDGITYQTDDLTETATATGLSGSSTVVSIPATVTHGGTDYAVTAIGDTAFISSGLTSLTLGDSIISIGEAAFYMNSLTTVTIPNTVKTIAGEAFAGNTLSAVVLGDSVTTIGDYAFVSNALTSVTIPDSVTTIGEGAFASNALTSATIGESVTSLGNGAFANNSLTTLSVPGSVTTIGAQALIANPALVSVVFQGAPPSLTAAGSAGSLGNNTGLLVYYPNQLAGAYDPGNTALWNGYATGPSATLSFDLNGHGASIRSVTVLAGSTLPATVPPADPVASGYAFAGWFTTAAGDTAFNFAAPFAADASAFAQWTGGPAQAAPATLPVMGTDPGPAGLIGAALLLLGATMLGWALRRAQRAG